MRHDRRRTSLCAYRYDRRRSFLEQFVHARLEAADMLSCSVAVGDGLGARGTHKGAWYSFPAAGECVVDEWPRLGGRASEPAAESTGTGTGTGDSRRACTWSSAAAQRVVHARHLIELGLVVDETATRDVSVEEVKRNADVLREAFERQPGHERCCGC